MGQFTVEVTLVLNNTVPLSWAVVAVNSDGDGGIDCLLYTSGAARIFSLEGFGSIVGGMPCGYVADMVGRKRYLVAAAIVAGIAGPAAFVAPPIPLLLGAICFTFGAATNSIYALSLIHI